ncbi:class I SAM-dependent methyltransferase [uncultured Methanobrevibacter sp.]|uniref:class I SAM-dependent DNA methyltransferase n=1 Tax=uncultured Methanobrevibacter sp. TaxID=253161 RepID=UPI002600B1F8|nr:class I SAM-dependent methyltransferase [uncultured Methanobrevibacter sp.]
MGDYHRDYYRDMSKIYDKVGIDKFSISFGNAMLKYFDTMHPDENFKKNLDFCCGTGTLCGFFKDNGIETKGVDISGEMLNIARNKYPDIEFGEQDIARYLDDETYDFITCIDDAFNHILDIDDAKKVIKNLNMLLRVNGLFILDLTNFSLLPKYIHDKSISKSINDSRLKYYLSKEENLFRLNAEYYENNELIWKNSGLERNYLIDELTKMFNDEGFVLESCSQHLFDEVKCIKWKIIFKKVK